MLDADEIIAQAEKTVGVTDTDVETLRNQYARRLNQSPPHPDSLLEYGDTMRENDRLEEAGEAYLSYIRAVEGTVVSMPNGDLVLPVTLILHLAPGPGTVKRLRCS